MIKKALLLCLLTLVSTFGAKAQDVSGYMDMLVTRMNSVLDEDGEMTEMEWDPATSSLIVYLNEKLLADNSMEQIDLQSSEGNQFIKNLLLTSGLLNWVGDFRDIFKQAGVNLVYRLPLGDEYIDIPISLDDLE